MRICLFPKDAEKSWMKGAVHTARRMHHLQCLAPRGGNIKVHPGPERMLAAWAERARHLFSPTIFPQAILASSCIRPDAQAAHFLVRQKRASQVPLGRVWFSVQAPHSWNASEDWCSVLVLAGEGLRDRFWEVRVPV